MYEYGNPDEMFYEDNSEAVTFYVIANEERILCRISNTAINDRFRTNYSRQECLDKAREYFDEVTDLAGEKIVRGLREKDGSILIKSNEFS